jgi:hypothetical protein
MTTETWVQYYIPGTLFSETETRQLTSRNITDALEHMPKWAFAFDFHDVVIKQGYLEDGETIENRKAQNYSGRYYPDATVYNLEAVEKEFGEKSILASNMLPLHLSLLAWET